MIVIKTLRRPSVFGLDQTRQFALRMSILVNLLSIFGLDQPVTLQRKFMNLFLLGSSHLNADHAAR